MTEPLLTPAQVAARLQVSKRAVLAWLRDGKIEGIKVGRQWRVQESAVAAYIERGKVGVVLREVVDPEVAAVGSLEPMLQDALRRRTGHDAFEPLC